MCLLYRTWEICGLLALAIQAAVVAADAPTDDSAALEAGFAAPPSSARARVYWWWLDSQVTPEGITRDLEAMKRQGIGGAIVMDAGVGDPEVATPPPPGPRFLSPEWRAAFRHALAEAGRLGLELSLNLGSGWNCGGPWITPELAAQKLVWSEMEVEGPSAFSAKLPLPDLGPEGASAFYRDVAVLAVRRPPLPKLPQAAMAAKVAASSSQEDHPIDLAVDGYLMTHWRSKGTRPGEGPTAAFPEWIQFEFAEPFTIRSFAIAPEPGHGPRECTLQWTDDGEHYQTLRKFVMSADKPELLDFPTFKSRMYRLVIDTSYDADSPERPSNVRIREITILAEGQSAHWVPLPEPIKHWDLKSVNKLPAFGQRLDLRAYEEQAESLPGEVQVDSRATVDLTRVVAPDGTLSWTVPRGKWTILRIGHTNTGRRVSTASPGGEGLVLDPLSRKALDVHLRAMAEPLIAESKEPGRRSLRYLHAEDWAVGPVNWTPGFIEQFRRRRGYDPLPYLPVLAGRIVDGRDISNRFLYDFRRTIGDCIAENHYGRLREYAHGHGLALHARSGGPAPAPIDALQCLAPNDVPMGEFDAPTGGESGEQPGMYVEPIASAAHVYGKNLVAARAFAAIGPQWEADPRALKPTADRAFCRGVNRVFIHTCTSSPVSAGRPGYEYFAATHCNPNVTWWGQSGPWNDYLARCQFMLSEGRFVADVCCYSGDGVPNLAACEGIANLLGPGYDHDGPGGPSYDYDAIDGQAILARMSVKENRLVLADGMSYRVLVLPDRTSIAPDVLRRVAQLVGDGATVVGPKPDRAPGLAGYPDADKEVRELADRLWGPCDGKTVTEHRVGKGTVIWGQPLPAVLLSLGVPPDFQCEGTMPDTAFDYIHRRVGEADVYFVANTKDRWEETACRFRVEGKTPELWWPDSGRFETLAVYDADPASKTIRAPVRLEPHGSVFVVFRQQSEHSRLFSIRRDGKAVFPVSPGRVAELPVVEVFPAPDDAFDVRVWVKGRYQFRKLEGRIGWLDVRATPAVRKMSGPWEVRFPKGGGAPEAVVFDELISWTEHENPGVKHFSGTAIYRKQFDVAASLFQPNRYLALDFGEVKNIAQVTLNGKDLGTLWKPPFRVDVTGLFREKGNVLEVKVTNLWPNRLIGDQLLPEGQRFTRTNIKKFTKDSPLLPSGLLGPVYVMVAGQERVKF